MLFQLSADDVVINDTIYWGINADSEDKKGRFLQKISRYQSKIVNYIAVGTSPKKDFSAKNNRFYSFFFFAFDVGLGLPLTDALMISKKEPLTFSGFSLGCLGIVQRYYFSLPIS